MSKVKTRLHARAAAKRWRSFVLIRDGFRCRLCGEPIDVTLPAGSPMSASVDHIVPLSAGGGSYEPNLQAAHRACNSARGNTVTEKTDRG